MGSKLSLFLAFMILTVACAPQQAAPEQQPSPLPAQQQTQPEIAKEVPISIEITSVPQSVKAGQAFQISWKIDGPSQTIMHTAVHYGSKSVTGVLGEDIGPKDVTYSGLTTEYAASESKIPGTFTGSITTPGVTMLYLRAHAIIAGKNYWTPEQAIPVEKSSNAYSMTNVKTHVIEADDNGFYPISSLQLSKGTKVQFIFKVRMNNVYYGGLDFRSDKFNSPSLPPGGSWTSPEITADEGFTVSSYWPASNRLKSKFTVNVS